MESAELQAISLRRVCHCDWAEDSIADIVQVLREIPM